MNALSKYSGIGLTLQRKQMSVPTTILAIESSCDETAASVCIDGKIASNIIATQNVHQQHGGVVPELASRAHMQNILVVVDQALQKANVQLEDINAFAYTQSPGLLGSLLVGASFCKSLALAQQKPLIEVHHMQAHIMANLIEHNNSKIPPFPFLCLTVSGGHTQIVLCKSTSDMKVIGQTLDDAAGEAFDKSAKLLGLPYPGGPLIDQYAKNGNGQKYQFPEPQIAGLDFSFSGLKTAILYFVNKHSQQDNTFLQNNLADICSSIQYTIVGILIKKMKKAIQQTQVKHICLAGGVSANSGLRAAFLQLATRTKCTAYIPTLEYCTDNAAMIAITAYYKFLNNDFATLHSSPLARSTW
jgi:N6-L-threonylcarbamoyladenine synthase